ncbi:hypothetical protein Q1695_011694 [Nippostrongylus brasiliensis]|nr:hypothetical protein Q1695_011694 [Nippostrongylus brasiliensis]
MHNLNRRTAKVASTPETPFEGNHGREEETRNPITEDTTENPEAASENPGESGEEGGIKNNVIAPYMHSLNRRTGKISSTPETPSEGNQGREEGTRKQNADYTTENPETASQNPSESGEESDTKDNVIASYMRSLNRRTAKVTSTPETPFEGNQGGEDGTGKQNTEDKTENPEAATENPGESGEEGKIKDNVIAPYMHSLNRRTGKISSTPETPSEGNQGREDGTRNPNTEDTTENPEAASENPGESGEESDTKDNVIASYMRSLNRRTAKVTSTPETPFKGNQGGEDGTRNPNTEDTTEDPEAASENPSESGEEGGIKNNVIAPYMHSLNRRTGKISSTPETPSEGNQGREEGTRNPDTEDVTENPEAATENPGESGEEGKIKDNVIAPYMHSLNRRTGKISSTPETPSEGNQGREDGTRNPNTEDTTEDPEAASENPSESGEEGGIKNNVIAPYMHSLNRRTGKISSTPEFPSEGNQGREEGTRNPNTEDTTEDPEAASENPSESGEEGDIKNNVIAPYMNSLNRRTGKISSTPEFPSEGNQGREDGTRNPNTEDTTEDPEAAIENPSESDEEGAIMNSVIAPYMNSLNRRTGKISSTPEFPSEGNQGREDGTRNPNTEDTTEDPEAAIENPSESDEEGAIMNSVIAPYMHNLNRRTAKVSFTPETPSEGNQGTEGTRKTDAANTIENPETASENPSESGEEGAAAIGSSQRGEASNDGSERGERENVAVQDFMIRPTVAKFFRRKATINSTREVYNKGSQGIVQGVRKGHATEKTETLETSNEPAEEIDQERVVIVDNIIKPTVAKLFHRTITANSTSRSRPKGSEQAASNMSIGSSKSKMETRSQQNAEEEHRDEKRDAESITSANQMKLSRRTGEVASSSGADRRDFHAAQEAAKNLDILDLADNAGTNVEQFEKSEVEHEKTDAQGDASTDRANFFRRTAEATSSSGVNTKNFQVKEGATNNLSLLDVANKTRTNVEQMERSEVLHEKTDAVNVTSTNQANFFRKTAKIDSNSEAYKEDPHVAHQATKNLSTLDVANVTRTSAEQVERSEVGHEKTDTINVASTNQANLFRRTAKVSSFSEANKKDSHVAHQAIENLSTHDVANETRTNAERVESSEVGHEKTDAVNVASTNQANLFRRTAKVSSFSETASEDFQKTGELTGIAGISEFNAHKARTAIEHVDRSKYRHEETDVEDVTSTNQTKSIRGAGKVSSLLEASTEYSQGIENASDSASTHDDGFGLRLDLERHEGRKHRDGKIDSEMVRSRSQASLYHGSVKHESSSVVGTSDHQDVEKTTPKSSIDSIREISATEDSFEVIQGKGHGSNFNEIEDIVDDPTFEEIFLQRVSPSP